MEVFTGDGDQDSERPKDTTHNVERQLTEGEEERCGEVKVERDGMLLVGNL